MKKKIIALLLAALMLLSCASCSLQDALLGGEGKLADFARGVNAALEGKYEAPRQEEDTLPPPAGGDTEEDGQHGAAPTPPAEDEETEDEPAAYPPPSEEDIAAVEARAIDRSPHEPFEEVWHEDIAFEDMSYTVYDSSHFLESADALSVCGNIYEAMDLYDYLYHELEFVESQYTICHILVARDITDKALQEDQVACEAVANECWDAFCTAVRDCLNGPAGELFAIYIGEEAAEAYLGYEDMTDREAELSEEETRLIALYYEQMEEADSYTFNYNGRDWTIDDLQGLAGARLSMSEWYMVYDGIQGNLNAVVGETYLQLIAVRHEIAQLAGYDSYADYAYENIYARDYTTDEAQVFCDTVKGAVAEAFFSEVYPNPLLRSNFSFNAEPEEMIAILGELAYSLDPRLGEAWDYFSRNRLYTLSDDPVMRQGGFTTTVNIYNAPYIHISLSGQLYDMGTLIHEFGHFSDAYWNEPNDLVLSGGCFDVFEIHSTGLEVIYQRFYPTVFGNRSSAAEFYSLLNLIYCVIDGCLYDEFQRTVYDNPDMTLDEINQLYYDLCIQYGQSEPTDVDYYWMYVHHNFEAPMYYISYAVSSLASLQIWKLQQEDKQAALDLYMDILGRGAYEYGYMELMDAVGLLRFSEEGAAAEICMPAIEYCAALE